MKNIITICIVLYNNERQTLQKAIQSCLDEKLNIRLFLVDNSPTDALKDIADDYRISYIHNPSNPGFGAAHNIAINESLKMGAKYHLVLNPDVYFDNGVIMQLASFMDSHPQVGNVMPKVLYPDGSIQYLCKLLPTPYDWIGRRFNPFKGMVERRNNLFELRFTKYKITMEVPYLSGCFMFLNTDAIKEVGTFDENIFMYGEETDLCRRLIRAGYKTIFFPDAVIYHYFEKGSHRSWRLTWIGIKSAIYYFNKWGWFFDSERWQINRRILNKIKKVHDSSDGK